MKETDAVVTLVLAFLAFAAFLFWAGMARAEEKPVYLMDYNLRQSDGSYHVQWIEFDTKKDCLKAEWLLKRVISTYTDLELTFTPFSCTGEQP